MDKVFILSLQRSATRSTTLLLGALGYRALHWPWRVGSIDVEAAIADGEDDPDHVWQVIRPVVDRFDAFSDTPFPVLYLQLFAAHPEARFVLMHRSPDAWLRSVRRHVGGRRLDVMERVLYWRYLAGRPERLSEVSDTALLAMHWRHLAEVTAWFAGHAPERFAVIGVDEPMPGERLQQFLGFPALHALPHLARLADQGEAQQTLAAALAENRASLAIAREAVVRAPDNPAFHRHLGRLLERAGEAGAARDAIARAEALETDLRRRAEERRTAAAG